ncbi:MAG: hypothetical protein K2J08_13445 [Ruminococcus sp.]|nr:hypothetical protein [Ruminococcus sp.]
MTEKIIEIRTMITDNVRYLDYSDYERRLQYIELRGRLLELRYNHNHDDRGRFCSGGGGGRMSSASSSENSEKDLDKSEKSVDNSNDGTEKSSISTNESEKSIDNSKKGVEKSVDKSEKSDTIEETPEQKQLRQMEKNGEVSLQINSNIQNRHYKGTSEYKTFSADGIEKSYFNVPQSELQQLLNEKFATGSVRIDKAGVAREIIDFGKNVGYDTKTKQETSFVKVHYSKRKTHMSPYTPNSNE